MARPREFEPEEALQKAMLLFWSKGYHDTSIRDLTARTGVNQYGLYAVFKNKLGLYLAALDHYRDGVTAEVLAKLKQPGQAAERIEAAYLLLIARMQTADGAVGCLIANAAVEVAPESDEAAEKVQAHMRLLRQAFGDRLERAKTEGQLSAEKDSESLGAFLATTAYSLGFLLRAGSDQATLRNHIRTALTTLT